MGAANAAIATATLDGLSVERSSARWQSWYVPAAVATDTVAGGFAAIAAWLVRFGDQAPSKYVLITLAFPLVWLLCLHGHRVYEDRFLGTGPEEFRRTLNAGLVMTAVVAITSYATQAAIARGYVVVAIPLAVVGTMAGRFVLRKRLHRRRHRGQCMQRVVVVGEGDAVVDLARQLSMERYHGLQVVAACLPEGGQRDELLRGGIPVLEGLGSVVRAVQLCAADTVAVVSSPQLAGPALRRLAWSLEPTGVDLIVAPGLVEVAGPRLTIRPAAGLPLLHVEPPALSGGRLVFKTVIDRLGAALLLVALLPALLGIAALVRCTSRGPALFRQRRIGAGGSTFELLKFRTMCVDAEARLAELRALNEHQGGVLFKMRHDPRLTRIGRVLRRYSLDELPQLVNVLRGQMSLVGPRPPLPEEVERYEADALRRLRVKPGLTGLWQVSGRADLSWEESLRLDLRYVDNWCLAMDLMILWKTGRAVVAGSGAY